VQVLDDERLKEVCTARLVRQFVNELLNKSFRFIDAFESFVFLSFASCQTSVRLDQMVSFSTQAKSCFITTVMTNVPLPPTSGQNHNNFGELLVSKFMGIYLHGYVLRSQPSHWG